MNVWTVICVFICGIDVGVLAQVFAESRRRSKENARAEQALAARRKRLGETGAVSAEVPE